jgi:DNA-binding beta-propeller fold protein YncE
MKTVLITATATALAAAALGALAAFCAWGAWVYEGRWGKYGTGNGEFDWPGAIATGPSGVVYVCDTGNHRVQCFTATGSFVLKWPTTEIPSGIGVFPRTGSVYVNVGSYVKYVNYYTPRGSLVGSWYAGHTTSGLALGAAPYVYMQYVEWEDQAYYFVKRFTLAGSFVGSFGHNKFEGGVGTSPDGQFVYVTCNAPMIYNDVYKYTAAGSSVWVRETILQPSAVEEGGGYVYVASYWYLDASRANPGDRLHVFTPSGSEVGYVELPFEAPADVAVSPSGERLYVTDTTNDQVHYFRVTSSAVIPTSLGRVKALFK